MKLFFLSFFSILLFTSFTHKGEEPGQLSFCDGIKRLQAVFEGNYVDSIKGNARVSNPMVYDLTIDIDELSDEKIGTQIGTFYQSTYKHINSEEEAESVMKELSEKIKRCFGKKAKKGKLNKYAVRVGNVRFHPMRFSNSKVLLDVSTSD